MPTEPAESLVQAAAEADALAAHVEAHLDAFPLPVDEAEVDAVVARLQGRMAPAPRRWRWAPWGGVVALAAAALLALRLGGGGEVPTAEGVRAEGEVPMALRVQVPDRLEPVQVVVDPGAVSFPTVGRRVEVPVGTRVLTSEERGAAVVLVQEGAAQIDGAEVPAGHWAVLGDDGSTVTFEDGQAPPAALEGDRWEATPVHDQLEKVRWQSLPDRTLKQLDLMMQKRRKR